MNDNISEKDTIPKPEKIFHLLVTLILVTPLCFYINFYDECRIHSNFCISSLCKALDNGPLFFISVTVASLARLEVWLHDKLRNDSIARQIGVLCIIPIVIMIFEWFRVRYGVIKPDTIYYSAQAGSLLFSYTALGILKIRHW